MKVIRNRGRIEIKHNKRKGLKLRKTKITSDEYSCLGCYLFELGRHCKRMSDKVNVCGADKIIYKKVYENGDKE